MKEDITDIDQGPLSPHHTLGQGHNQAAPGDHGTHHLEGVTLIGAKGGSVVITSIVAALVALGATDSTT
jgi:hypothetical protein